MLVVTFSLSNASLYPLVSLFLVLLYSYLVGTDEAQVAEDCDSQDFGPKLRDWMHSFSSESICSAVLTAGYVLDDK